MADNDVQKSVEDLKSTGVDATKDEVAEAHHGARDDYGRDRLKNSDAWWEEEHPKAEKAYNQYRNS